VNSAHSVSLPDSSWANDLPIEHVPAAVAQLASLQSALAARWMGKESGDHSSDKPRWKMTIEDMEKMTGKPRRWLFAHADELPFVSRVSLKVIKGDETLCLAWITERRGGKKARRGT
jgi:hypothetical protein